MQTLQHLGATSAPCASPEALQRQRVVGRVAVSTAVAGVLAGHAYGSDRRDHCALLVALVAERIGGRAHG